MTKPNKLEANTAALKRWRTRLKRAMTMLDKLERQRKRLEAAPRVYAKEVDHSVVKDQLSASLPMQSLTATIPSPNKDSLGIPDFLKRGVAAQKAVDEVIADQIKAEQEDTKKKKARGRIEKMKAKQRGDLKKMPLSGKAALQAIDKAD